MAITGKIWIKPWKPPVDAEFVKYEDFSNPHTSVVESITLVTAYYLPSSTTENFDGMPYGMVRAKETSMPASGDIEDLDWPSLGESPWCAGYYIPNA
jgi:hypothetical protein